MSYLDEVMALTNRAPAKFEHAHWFGIAQELASEIAARADARIAELELECSQWRDELRIYRETENKRIAELESALLAERERICAAIKATDDAASACDYMLDSDDCIAVVRGELGPANYEDAARAGNGGEG